MNINDEAYTEVCQELEQLKKKLLSPQERGYLLGLLKEHLEYWRTLSGNAKASAQTKEKRQFMERLILKLAL
jgi:hypothetical protein